MRIIEAKTIDKIASFSKPFTKMLECESLELNYPLRKIQPGNNSYVEDIGKEE